MSTLRPVEPRRSIYNLEPQHLLARAALNLPGMTSIRICDLFPDCPDPISAESPSEVIRVARELTMRSLEGVNLEKIQA